MNIHTSLARVLLALVTLFSVAGAAFGKPYDEWGQKMKIQFAGHSGNETLTNYPVLVVFSTNGIPGFDYASFTSPSDGADLRFSDSNGTVELNYEIDTWNTNGSSYVWVEVPSISSTDDFIYAYWSYATVAAPCTTNGSTWTNGFKGVWHLTETSGPQNDSTVNRNGVVMSGTVSQGTTGFIGGADDCTSGYAYTTNNLGITGGSSRTISMWFRQDAGSRRAIAGYGVSGSNMQILDVLLLGGVMAHFYGQNTPAVAYTVGEWQHTSVTYDGSTVIIYVNGVLLYQGSGWGLSTADAPLWIGAGKYDISPFNGKVDEVQISTVVRSANWVHEAWFSQASNSSYLVFSELGAQANSISVRADPASGIGPTSATMNGTIMHDGYAEDPDTYFCWGGSDGGTNATSSWANVEYVGAWAKDQSFSTNITGLVSSNAYFYRCYVTNSTGTNWSRTLRSFTTIFLPAVTNVGASHVGRRSVTFGGRVTVTGGEAPTVWINYWDDATYTTNVLPVGAQGSSFSSNVTGLTAGTLYHYSLLASNSAGAVWSGVADFSTRAYDAYGWYVSLSGDNTYATNWATALTNVQEALINAGSNDTIYVKGETFTLRQQLGWSNSFVTVLGGYEGTGTPGNRNSATWPTVLTRSSADGNTRRILYIDGVTNGYLDGVTITNGYLRGRGSWVGDYRTSGAGIYANAVSGLTIANCSILYNGLYEENQDGGWVYGAGIFAPNGSVTVSNCVISSNNINTVSTSTYAHGGGGAICALAGTWTILDCMFVENRVQGDYNAGNALGGAIYMAGNADVRNCVFYRNDTYGAAGQAGDAIYTVTGTLSLRNCLVASNCLAGTDRAIYQDSGTCTLENSTIVNNRQYGVWRQGGTMTISNCILWANGDDIYEISPALALKYSDVEDGDNAGNSGCISSDPLFVDAMYYHPQSPYGNYTGGFFSGGSWSTAVGNSPTIDACAAGILPVAEPHPNGGIVNMGYDGNLAVASKSHPLAVTNRAATALGSTFATLNGTVQHVGSLNVHVWFYYGLTDEGTTAANWDTNVYLGTIAAAGNFSTNVTGLSQNSEYFYTMFASNDAGATAWAEPSTNFLAVISAPVVVNRGAVNEAGPTVTLTGEVLSNGGENPTVYICWGLTEGTTATSSWEHVEARGTQSGAFQMDVSTLAGSNYFYTCFATNSGGGSWATPAVPFGTTRIRYVDSGATGTGTGYSWENACTTIQAALNDCLSGKTNLVCVKTGTYTLISTLNLTASDVTLQGGYEGNGTPGNVDPVQWPTVITNSGAITRFLTISGVEDGTIRDLTFTGGNAAGSGGAISMANATNMVVDNCIFRGNQTAVNGGAVYASSTENLTLQNCTMRSNVALNNSGVVNGGAIYVTGSSGTITNCVIERNIVSSTYNAGQTHRGGGVCILGGGWTIRDSRISYNVASAPITAGGGIYVEGSATHSIKNCVLVQNDAIYGDGIAVSGWNGPTIAINNCTLFGNIGHGVYKSSDGGSVTLQNSILWENGDDVNGAVTLINCDVQDGDAGVGCISVDPLFERGVYLAAGSLCVDAGSDTAASFGLDGYTTRVDGTLDTAGNVDLGYHAFTGITIATGDLYVKNTGNDNNSGTSWGQAFQTITKALAEASDGTRIHVEAGTYSTNTLEAFPLSLTRVGLQLLGTNSATTVIDASGSNQRAVDMGNSSYGRIEGFTVCGGGPATGAFYGSGAGLYIANVCGTVVSDCIVSNNRAGRNGGGIYVGNGRDITVDGAVVVANVMDVADRDQERWGGGMFVENSYGLISNCVFQANAAMVTLHGGSYTRTKGGGLSLSGGAWNVVKTVFANNSAHCDVAHGFTARGGGLHVYSGTHAFQNCLVVTNRILVADGNSFGHGVDIDGGVSTFVSVTVASNGREGVRLDGGTLVMTNTILYTHVTDLTNAAGTVTAGFCDVGVTSAALGANCVSVDPLFVDGEFCHLQSKRGSYKGGYFTGGTWSPDAQYSPVIDAGPSSYAYRDEPSPHGFRINMGAYGNTPVASLSSAAQGTIFVVH